MRDLLLVRRRGPSRGGGIEGQMLRLARALESRGILHPILLTSHHRGSLAEAFRHSGFPVYAVPMAPPDGWRAAARIDSILARHDVAVVQSHMFRESLFARGIRRRHPEIRHVLRAQTYIDCSCNPRWKKRLYHILDKLTSRYVDCYAANGQYLADEIVSRSWVRRRKVRALLNGRDPIGPPDMPCASPRAPLPARMAMVANLLPRKGHDVLVRALGRLVERGLRPRVRLIGSEATDASGSPDARLGERLRAEARRLGVLGQIEFHGHTDDVHGALRGFPIVVLPSDSEGVPNCILEAMGLRKLVIASRVGGVPEIIRDGTDGLLHPPQDPCAFAACVERVLSAPAARWEPVRDAARRTWQQTFTMGRMVDELIAIYKEVGALN